MTLGSNLQKVTGWALLVAALGVFWDAAAYWTGSAAQGEGSLGLIPAYLGMFVGLIGLTLVNWRVGGALSGLLAGLGTAGTFVFWGGYPSYSTAGGLGALVLAVSTLYLPGWGRFASPLWVSAGVMYISELVVPGRSWGPISAFTLIGSAFAATGAFVLWGLSDNAEEPATPSRSSVQTP